MSLIRLSLGTHDIVDACGRKERLQKLCAWNRARENRQGCVRHFAREHLDDSQLGKLLGRPSGRVPGRALGLQGESSHKDGRSHSGRDSTGPVGTGSPAGISISMQILHFHQKQEGIKLAGTTFLV